MTPKQASRLKELADSFGESASALVLVSSNNARPEVLDSLLQRAKSARRELFVAIDNLTHPVLAVVPRRADEDEADYVGNNYNIAIALLDRELARSKA